MKNKSVETIFRYINNIWKFSENEINQIKVILNDEKFLELDINWNHVLRNLDYNNLEKSLIERYNIVINSEYLNKKSSYSKRGYYTGDMERPKFIN